MDSLLSHEHWNCRTNNLHIHSLGYKYIHLCLHKPRIHKSRAHHHHRPLRVDSNLKACPSISIRYFTHSLTHWLPPPHHFTHNPLFCTRVAGGGGVRHSVTHSRFTTKAMDGLVSEPSINYPETAVPIPHRYDDDDSTQITHHRFQGHTNSQHRSLNDPGLRWWWWKSINTSCPASSLANPSRENGFAWKACPVQTISTSSYLHRATNEQEKDDVPAAPRT